MPRVYASKQANDSKKRGRPQKSSGVRGRKRKEKKLKAETKPEAKTEVKVADEKERSFRIEGVCAAVFTPFRENLSVNFDVIPMQVDDLQRQGVGYVFVGGTTGEGYKLTIAERKALAEKWITSAGNKIQVIVHVGAESLEDVKDLAAHAQAKGARAIGLIPSSFFKPRSPTALASWLLEASKAAPNLPLYYYHIAIMTGVDFRMEKVLEAVEGVVPTFRGLKFTDYNLHSFAQCIRYKDFKYDLVYGRDEQALGAAVMGCTGYIGSTYNYMAPVYHRMFKALASGDMKTALLEQSRSQQVVAILENAKKYGEDINVGKAILELSGVQVGPPRPPEVALSQKGFELLKTDLADIGFFRWRGGSS